MIFNTANDHTDYLKKILKEVSIFQDANDAVLQRIATSLEPVDYPPNTQVVSKGDVGDAMYVIKRGSVKVHDGDYTFSVKKKDSVFGEYYLIDSEERSASVTTLEESHMLRIDQDTFYKLMASDLNITSGILKTAVRRLRRMNVVEETLASKNIEIEQHLRSLKEINDAKDKFLSIVAHDVRSPLGTIFTLFDYLSNEIDSISKEDIAKELKKIRNTSGELIGLLDDLLKWAGLQRGSLARRLEVVPLRPLVEKVMGLFELQASYKNIIINNLISDEVRVKADKNMIQTVMRNLISNAMKFSYPGQTIRILAEEENDLFLVSVKDTGVGIDNKVLEDIFKIDVKVSTEGTRNEKGSGLGLQLCKDFIEKNDGSLHIESEKGAGTTISFSLPKASA